MFEKNVSYKIEREREREREREINGELTRKGKKKAMSSAEIRASEHTPRISLMANRKIRN